VEIGLVIGGHYLLQRLIKQGEYCTVYQGLDQLFQRSVAVKAVPAAQMSIYRAAVRMTSQFSYPNIVGLYDLVAKPDKLYLVQEYVEGDDFMALLQAQLQPYTVTDIGRQICSALIYANSSSRRVCHGDLTPASILRDERGFIRVNNFALPSNLLYFTAWSILGGEGAPVSDRDLPWGVTSEGRLADDTRAVGLLLYQLLTSRPPGVTVVEPPADGRLRFPRNVPAELCEIVARTVIRQHPQHIVKIEMLYDELKTLAETLEPAVPVLVSTPAQPAEMIPPGQFSPSGAGAAGNAPPVGQPIRGSGLPPYRSGNSGKLTAVQMESSPAALTIADSSLRPSATRQMGYPGTEEEAPPPAQHSSLLWLLLLGLIIFALFFVVGFFAGHFFIPHP